MNPPALCANIILMKVGSNVHVNMTIIFIWPVSSIIVNNTNFLPLLKKLFPLLLVLPVEDLNKRSTKNLSSQGTRIDSLPRCNFYLNPVK
jgi:hypothetical protein